MHLLIDVVDGDDWAILSGRKSNTYIYTCYDNVEGEQLGRGHCMVIGQSGHSQTKPVNPIN